MSSQCRRSRLIFQWLLGVAFLNAVVLGGQALGAADMAGNKSSEVTSKAKDSDGREAEAGAVSGSPGREGLLFFQPVPSDSGPASSKNSQERSSIPQSPESPEVEDEEDVPVLAESVVEESFVDPFEEEGGEQIEDPWEPFNSSMFTFNRQLDLHVLKPFARGYNHVVPYEIQRSIDRIFDNIRIVPRLVNTLAQAKWQAAGIVMSRFLINSTIGVGGMFDVAGEMFDIKDRDFEDMGQTLAVHGVPPGPYLVVPFLAPTTVRDGIGQLVDSFLNPLNYFLPLAGQLGWRGEETVNDRSLNLEVFEGVEESTVDLYGAVREAYIQKRAQAIKE